MYSAYVCCVVHGVSRGGSTVQGDLHFLTLTRNVALTQWLVPCVPGLPGLQNTLLIVWNT